MLNAARVRQIAQGQTTIAMKVYEAIPIEGAWGAAQIRGEMQRVGMSTPDQRILEGCLKALVDAGLVREGPSRLYCRAPVKPDVVKPILQAVKPQPDEQENEDTTMPTATAAPATKLRTPIDILSPIAEKLREMVKMQRDRLNLMDALADDIDNAAAELEERNSASAEEIRDLRQLKALLKNLGG